MSSANTRPADSAGTKTCNDPQKVTTYFRMEWKALLIVTVTGLIYNLGILAGPFFEGLMAQCLVDLAAGHSTFLHMLQLVLAYLLSIAVVQSARYLKRLYVRHFANNIGRSMKENLYANLIHRSRKELGQDNAGSLLTKAISDVEACAEGMRKFTTEIFDTGVALLSYAFMLLHYDVRLALLCLIFPPISYAIAEKMKTVVQRTGQASRESAGRLNAATMDRISNALTYRVLGCDAQRDQDYETYLADYEKRAVWANIWVQVMPPIYQMISMISILFILWFGSRNVLGTGWSTWNIAAFTTFLSCYTKLCVKSSHAAKLFNAIHKAQVSWKRIQPLLSALPEDPDLPKMAPGTLTLTDPVLQAAPGEIIGITGPVACGKSTFGRRFLGESDYPGSIRFDGKELRELSPSLQRSIIGYLGHDPELQSDTIRNNILMGDSINLQPYLQAVCLEPDLASMPDGLETRIGDGGVRLSGGQQKRVALARTLAHPRPVLILDDPFSALDKATEEEIFRNLQQMAKAQGFIVLLISHRLTLFPRMDQLIWMEDGNFTVSTHSELMQSCPHYAELYHLQSMEGGDEQ